MLHNRLLSLGLDDYEDSIHLAALRRLKQNRKIVPLFVTTDRELCDLGPEIYKRFSIVIEDALYAVDTYFSMLQRHHSIGKVEIYVRKAPSSETEN